MKILRIVAALAIAFALLAGLSALGRHVAVAQGPFLAAVAVLGVLSIPATLSLMAGAHFALGATNSLGTLSGTIVIQRALEMTFQRFPQLKLFARGFKDYDGRVSQARLNQDVVSRIHVPSSVTNFGTPASNFNATDVPGKLRNFRQVYHSFTPAEVNATERRLIDEAALPMANGLAIQITASIARQVSRSRFGLTSNGAPSFVEVASGWTYANTIAPLRTAVIKRGMPDADRYFVANADVDGSLITDPVIIAALNNPANANAIERGELPAITGGLRYGNYAGLGGADGNLLGYAGTPDALLYIARAPMTPDEVFGEAAARAPFIYGIIIEPNTGFAVMVQQWIDTNLEVHTRLAWLDGLEIGNANNLVRLVSGAAAGTAGQLVGLSVVNPGYEYKNSSGVYTAPTITISGGGGSGATATATIDSKGCIENFTITAPGSGYTSPPTVQIAPPAGGRFAGEATAVATVGGLA